MPSQHEKNFKKKKKKTLKALLKQKIYPIKKFKKKKPKIYVFGRISYDPSATLNILVRWDHKIVRW